MSANIPRHGGGLSSAETLPSWAEISSLSDDDLYELFNRSQHRFPEPNSLKFTSVRRIASDAVMKVGFVPDSEPLTMRLVRDTTTILVPAVRRFFTTVEGGKAIVMDYVPGPTLQDGWESLTLWQRLRVIWTIRRYIRELRNVLVPGVARCDQFPGPIASEPQVCQGPMFGGYGGGPFASYEELTSWFMHKLEVNRRIRKTPQEDMTFDSSLPLVLTHLDLFLNNIILDGDCGPWLIDWEFAGFYPQWFEYVMIQHDWEILERWRKWIMRFMAGFYDSQLRFMVSIGWAIWTGALL